MTSLKSIIDKRVRKRISRLMLKLILPYRISTSRSRAVPNMILIGAQKSGTSSLFSYLGQHPQFYPSIKKEIHYFDEGLLFEGNNYEKGEAWYRAHFPLEELMDPGDVAFEASPLYIFNPLVAERIFNFVPNVKIIAILRNPTERAISHYFHMKRIDQESLSIYEAMQKEEKRLEFSIKEGNYKSEAYIHHSYKSRGFYAKQLERYFKYFPRNQILILNSEELFREPESTLKKVFEFAGVDSSYKVNCMKRYNVSTNRTKVDSCVYDYLNDYFHSHNRELYELIGTDFGW